MHFQKQSPLPQHLLHLRAEKKFNGFPQVQLYERGQHLHLPKKKRKAKKRRRTFPILFVVCLIGNISEVWCGALAIIGVEPLNCALLPSTAAVYFSTFIASTCLTKGGSGTLSPITYLTFGGRGITFSFIILAATCRIYGSRGATATGQTKLLITAPFREALQTADLASAEGVTKIGRLG